MPFYKRYWNKYKNKRRRRYPTQFWRPRQTFRGRRKRRTVRRRRKYKKLFKKLKFIKLKQWQPEKIVRCKIIGYLELFETTAGRVSNNYVKWKESFVPPQEPGGGGWGMQQLSLGNLYTQNLYIMNYWTKSNKALNLCRYLGVKIILYRQQNVDWIFTYNLQEPRTITKYTYASYHPYKLLTYNHKIIVPSLKTQPLKKKTFKRKFIRPPKQLTNKWYFQNHLSNTPLLTFFATACSLNNLFIPSQAQSNNITLNALNTKFFQHPIFQYLRTSTTGFHPDKAGNQSIWGIAKQSLTGPNYYKQLAFLGNSMMNVEGVEIEGKSSAEQYKQEDWGNPFFFHYLTNDVETIVTNDSIQTIFSKKSTQIPTEQYKHDPYIIPIRYNPNKDKGIGNKAYFLTTYDATHKSWDPPTDPELIIENFPLWLMLWGFEEYMLNTGKISKLDENGILVIRSPYFNESLPAYVFLSDSFVHGQGPYEQDRDHISTYNNSHWYPRWKYQKEEIENLLATGPAVAKPAKGEAIQAHLKYQFFFKWGGNPSTMETVYDPNSQPVGPDPNLELINNEIISPTESIENLIYSWDVRHDTITQSCAQRISQIPINEQSLFTDGTTTTEFPPPKKKKAQTTTTKEEEETQLLQQLNLLQQHNQQLQHRFRQLKTILESTS
nr:MAG: ORF1 [TTV-like mini virus]